MAKPKKTSPKKALNRSKTVPMKNPSKEKGISKKTVAPKTKQAKPNLQPARIIKKPDPAPVEPAIETAVEAPPTETLKQAESAVAETAPEESVKTVAAPEEMAPKQAPTKAGKSHKKSKQSAIVASAPLESSVSSTENLDHKKTAKPSLSMQRQRRRLGGRLLITGTLLLLAAIGVWVFFGSSPNENEANKLLIREVSKRVVVPEDETPTITTVVDETKVSQEFLRGTKKGDKVLLYFQAGRAIVYRQSSGQVVNMGPIETPTPRVFLRDGSTTANLNAVINKMRASSDFILTSRDASPKKTYEKTVVIDVAGNRPDVAARLAELLGADVGNLPDGESRPDADLLVIVGSDQAKQ